MSNLEGLEKKYEELGKEIERLKKEQEAVGFKDDPIFLLSSEEYKKYKDRIPQINCWWWLRSSDYKSKLIAGFRNIGSACGYGSNVSCGDFGIRPALKICRSKNIIIFNGVTWVKIDKDLYISELPIGFRHFDEESNDYETSKMRRFLMCWYEERLLLNNNQES